VCILKLFALVLSSYTNTHTHSCVCVCVCVFDFLHFCFRSVTCGDAVFNKLFAVVTLHTSHFLFVDAAFYSFNCLTLFCAVTTIRQLLLFLLFCFFFWHTHTFTLSHVVLQCFCKIIFRCFQLKNVVCCGLLAAYL